MGKAEEKEQPRTDEKKNTAERGLPLNRGNHESRGMRWHACGLVEDKELKAGTAGKGSVRFLGSFRDFWEK
jgi:hypothetical protein